MDTSAGIVHLVGAGPGDPGLITVKGLRRLKEADVVVYDRLVDPRLLDEIKEDAEVIFAGKDPGRGSTQQENIYPLLIDKAREGKRVVRLKGGDPFVFGRGGEEAQVLAMAGIPFEVVPGITSAIAAPAYAGIPLTHREAASSFTVVSGVEDSTKKEPTIPWGMLAHTGGTLVVLMGWGSLANIVTSLLAEGMNPLTPVALIRWGTEPRQQTVTGTLENIVRHGEDAGLSPPVVAVIGSVVRLREEIRWYDHRPLSGKRVLVTRSRPQASVLSQLLADEGAEPIELPTIQIAPLQDYTGLDAAIRSLSRYHWVIFTSVNAVDTFFARIQALGLDSRILGPIKVCAIGPATATALEHRAIQADFVPSQFRSSSIVEGMAGAGLEGARVLLPRADIAPPDLAEALATLGAEVDQQVAYRTIVPEESRRRAHDALQDGKIDVVTFTSSSTVRNLLNLLQGDKEPLERVLIACIGPETAKTAQDLELKVGLVASEHTVRGLVNSLKHHLARDQGVKDGSLS